MSRRYWPVSRVASRTSLTAKNSPESGSRPKAAALRYTRDVDSAPRLVAKGQGETAQRIVSLAREHGVPVLEDEGLAEALNRLELDSLIPEELYQAVAEVLAFVYRLDASYRH